MNIQRIPRDELIKEKWNGCVHYAPNGNIFGYMWYLDFVAKDWEALVEDDYVSVFPLVYRQNWWGRPELYQPDLMRAMGIYSVKALSAIRIKAFLAAIPEAYKKIDITVNARNRPPRDDSFRTEEKANHLLMLKQPYESMRQNYSEAFQQRLKAAEAEGLLSIGSIKPEKLADFYKKQRPRSAATERQFHALQRIMYNVLHRGTGFASAITHPDDPEELLAADFFIFSHGRMLSLAPSVSTKGKQFGALEMLYDYMIRSNANRPLLLDFNTDGDTAFAKSVGAQSENYYRIYRKQGWF
jgi:hypothetical protein